MKILMIDDSYASCRAVNRILADVATVSCCIKSSDWLTQYAALLPDIILLDVLMPTPDGLDVLRQIREMDSDTPVIMVTAMSDKATVKQCLDLGANGYITKPVSIEKLKNAIHNIGGINTLKNLKMDTASCLTALKAKIQGGL